MKKMIKQFLCRHNDIVTTTKTDSNYDKFLIVETLIQCKQCEKTFAQHPNAQCCYVKHIQSEIIQQKFIEQSKKGFPHRDFL